jgi:heme O synthase-like polyprenyltransferase
MILNIVIGAASGALGVVIGSNLVVAVIVKHYNITRKDK